LCFHTLLSWYRLHGREGCRECVLMCRSERKPSKKKSGRSARPRCRKQKSSG
jgi:hypothetical protein